MLGVDIFSQYGTIINKVARNTKAHNYGTAFGPVIKAALYQVSYYTTFALSGMPDRRKERNV